MKHSTFALVCSWVAIAIFRINIRVWKVIILGAFQKCLYFSCPLYQTFRHIHVKFTIKYA
jgi:hypothetical protein